MLFEVEKLLSMDDGQLAGISPGLIDEAFVIWLPINQVKLTECDADHLMDILRPTEWLL